MHEVHLCEQILKRILNHPEVGSGHITEVRLALDPGQDLDERRLQDAFDLVSAGTAAAGARLKITEAPLGELRLDSIMVSDQLDG